MKSSRMSSAIVLRRQCDITPNIAGIPDWRGQVPGTLQRPSALACDNIARPPTSGTMGVQFDASDAVLRHSSVQLCLFLHALMPDRRDGFSDRRRGQVFRNTRKTPLDPCGAASWRRTERGAGRSAPVGPRSYDHGRPKRRTSVRRGRWTLYPVPLPTEKSRLIPLGAIRLGRLRKYFNRPAAAAVGCNNR